MRSDLLASLTSKIVIGVAATTLAAGSAGAVALQTISDEAPTAAETSVEIEDTTLDDSTLTDELEEQDTDGATENDAAEGDEDEVLEAFDEEIDTPTAHPDNFGKIVSERAHANGGNKGGVADLAHEKNAERKGSSDDDSDVEADDADDADDVDDVDDDSDDDESAEVADDDADSDDAGPSKGHGKGKNKD